MRANVLTQAAAWDIYRTIRADPRVSFFAEPEGLEEEFQAVSNREEVSHKRWADDYLAAFAQTAGVTLVIFARALAARVPSATLLTP